MRICELQPEQYQVNLCVKVIAKIMISEVDDYTTWTKIKVAEFLVGDSSGYQIPLFQPETNVILHNARVEMYRGFMRIVIDQNTNAKIINDESEIIDYLNNHNNLNNNNISNNISINTSNNISNINNHQNNINIINEMHPNLDKNISLTEYQYVPNVVLNEE
ncbi:4579_t:CDS:2 [Diversispora eburnea]|uniref:4579_t:CDS:1 n=1 Tax=Diversispora eburnea TaxID=1213867 RepID=A0A9N8ZS19_9GLOM|nr:4579_t:CDS:2 [Diversispora eburnea]